MRKTRGFSRLFLLSLSLAGIVMPALSFGQTVYNTIKKNDWFTIDSSPRKMASFLDNMVGKIDKKNLVSTNPSCAPELLRALLGAQQNILWKRSKIEAFFETCQKSRARLNEVEELAQLYKTAKLVEYDSNYRPVVVRLSDGKLRNGMLALKEDSGARPLIIIVTGFASSSVSFVATNLLRLLFEETPFNVLVLANISGDDYIKDNREIVFGGFEEGRQIFDLARRLVSADSPLRPLISSIHVLGVSLGGQAALYSGYYNDFVGAGKLSPISSILAACPIVDLEESLLALQRDDWFGRKYRDSIWRLIGVGASNLDAKVDPKKKPSVFAIVDTIEKYLGPSLLRRFQNPMMMEEPFKNEKLQTMKDFWRLNHFSNFAAQLKTPALVWYAADDSVAAPKLNGDTLLPYSQYLTLKVPMGNHCLFDLYYGSEVSRALFQEFVLSHSPEFSFKH